FDFADVAQQRVGDRLRALAAGGQVGHQLDDAGADELTRRAAEGAQGGRVAQGDRARRVKGEDAVADAVHQGAGAFLAYLRDYGQLVGLDGHRFELLEVAVELRGHAVESASDLADFVLAAEPDAATEVAGRDRLGSRAK